MLIAPPQGLPSGPRATGIGTIPVGQDRVFVAAPQATSIDRVMAQAAGQQGSNLLPIAVLSVQPGQGFVVGTLTGAVTLVAQQFAWVVF